MARQDTLLRLHKTLLARRVALCKTLADELLRDFRADSVGDSADMAFDSGSDEISSQLAELDSRELSQVEQALARLKDGMYGICEGNSGCCQRKIPVSRLNALPYATLCIACEREMEKSPGWQNRPATGQWDQIVDSEAYAGDRRFDLSKLEMGLSSDR